MTKMMVCSGNAHWIFGSSPDRGVRSGGPDEDLLVNRAASRGWRSTSGSLGRQRLEPWTRVTAPDAEAGAGHGRTPSAPSDARKRGRRAPHSWVRHTKDGSCRRFDPPQRFLRFGSQRRQGLRETGKGRVEPGWEIQKTCSVHQSAWFADYDETRRIMRGSRDSSSRRGGRRWGSWRPSYLLDTGPAYSAPLGLS
jgi:hypothetical protein